MSDSLDRLYRAVLAARTADPATSRTARLLRSGRSKMAKKLAEEAVEVVIDAMRLGLDQGSDPVLERYQSWRRFDTALMAAVTDNLNRLFSNDVAPVRLARDAGFFLFNRIMPLKRLAMRHAMGVVGKLPRLVQGKPL